MAAALVKESVVSIDSSASWLAEVAEYCSRNNLATMPRLVHADIGPTRDWGYPADPNTKHSWPSYHTKIWTDPGASLSDLYFVDGRFRVACFMQVILHCEASAFILFHDFTSRDRYHIVREVAREVAVVEDLSVFQPLSNVRERANEILSCYELESA